MFKLINPAALNLAILGIVASLGLSACNSSGSSTLLQPNVPSDSTNPTPTPTSPGGVQPKPTPTATTSPKPSPTPSATPKPSPTPSSSPTDVSGLYTGPAEVAKFVQKFVDDAKAQGVDVLPDMASPKLEIQIASLDSYGSSVIGLCETSGNRRRVTFDPDFWNSVSETQKELLTHHELGHCVLYRGHDTATLSSGAYASIMYPIIMSSSTYTNNYNYYQQELFTQVAQAAPYRSDPNTVTTHICDLKDLVQP